LRDGGRPIISPIETSTGGLLWTETLVRVCPMAIVRTDAEGRVSFCNPAFEHTFQYEADEAAGKPLEELIGLHGGEARRKDGVRVDVESSTLPELENGVCVGYLYFFQDVSARRSAERALKLSEETFSNAFRLSPVTFTIATAGDNRLIEVNDKWIELTGYSREEAVGRTPLELGLYEDPEDAHRLNRLVDASGGSIRNVECRLRMKNGTPRPIAVSIAEFTVNDQSLRLVVGADLTPLRAAEARLSDVSRKMLDAQELERLRIGRELHDNVGQRLALLNMGLVQAQADVDKLVKAVAECLSDLSTQAASISKDIRTISHELYSPQLRLLDLGDALKGLCSQLERHLAIEIAFSGHGVPHHVPADISLCLFRVLQEGLINAAKHSDTRRIDVELRGTSRTLDLRIRDFGGGFSVGAASEGLGLVSMRERVAMVGGTFAIASTLHSGTEIKVQIPLGAASPDAAEGRT
jgi:PAS domain S-box-containing protein